MGSTGLVVITWDAPIGTPTRTPSITPTPTRTRSLTSTVSATNSPSSGATPSTSASASVSPFCAPSVFRQFPFKTLDGDGASAPLLLRSERDCQRACCDVPACQGYTMDSNTLLLGGSFAPCYLFTNVTQLVPNAFGVSGVKFAGNS